MKAEHGKILRRCFLGAMAALSALPAAECVAAVAAKAQPLVVNPSFATFDACGAPVGWSFQKTVFHAARGEGMNGSGGLVWENDDTNRYIYMRLPTIGP